MNSLSDIKAIAFYLPKYHRTPENDKWSGEEFTDWTNVRKARPNYKGHYQPHVPLGSKYYNLLDPEVREAQAALAKKYGIHGFCYYYYWFSGRKILNQPIEGVLKEQKPDFPYCICWANQSWSRTWEGKDQQLLIEQKYDADNDLAFIQEVAPFLGDPRYITVSGKPLLLVYRVADFPEPRKTAAVWRAYFKKHFDKDLYLVFVRSFNAKNSPGDYGFDASVEFPPHQVSLPFKGSAELLNPDFQGRLCSYPGTATNCINQTIYSDSTFRGIIPGWDNTARRQNDSLIMVNSHPRYYEAWLHAAAKDTASRFKPDEQLLFVNAWNEWEQGCHLEPDEKYGFAYLEATRRVLSGASKVAMPENENLFSELAEAVPSPDAGKSPRGILATAGNIVFKFTRGLYRSLPLTRRLKYKLSTWMYTCIHELTRKPERHVLAYRDEQLFELPAPVGRIETGVPLKNIDLAFKVAERPEISMIIAVHNQWDYTLACLRSIVANMPEASFEIIVIDDCSTDHTPEALKVVKGIKVITNSENQGFLLSCNRAAKKATGKYLYFLNNDVQVLPGWLDELHQTFTQIPEAGLVGSKLIYPDGRLQEAGGIIWEDGSGANFGRGDDPRKPEYNFLRDPDYCSGASIMLPAKVFHRLGGFDERFVPAYYEDTDLAYSVRQMGLRVIYQPFSQVVHFEGITSGTDISSGIKAYQEINKSKFFEKWKAELVTHRSSGLSSRLDTERNTKKALLIDLQTPRPDTDSASMDTVYYLKMLQHLGYKVSFIANDLQHSRQYTENLQRLGVECLYEPYVSSVGDYLRQCGPEYRLVFMQRVHYVNEYFEQARRFCVNARLIFNTVDLHYLREQRYAELEDSDLMRRGACTTKAMEFGIMRNSDATIVVSQEEKNILEREAPDINVFCIPYVREIMSFTNAFSARKDIVFIGGFNHLPNIDAVKYFIKDVLPLVRERLPDVIFRIVGSNIPGTVFKEEEVNELAAEPGVEIAGFVEDLDNTFNQCRISVAPLRFGAGIKGKIGTSLCYGVPCVATPIAVEGMDLEHRTNVLVGSTADDFADEVVSLYTDEELWNRISSAGITFMKEHYSFERGLQRLGGMIETIC